MDQTSSGEGKRGPSNGERANYQAYERAIVMKHSIGFERQISAKANQARKEWHQKQDVSSSLDAGSGSRFQQASGLIIDFFPGRFRTDQS